MYMGKEHQQRYAVYIDCGSSGTRVHVFHYSLAVWPSYVDLELPEQTHAVEPGLSSHADDPQAAAQSLVPLLQFAYDHVPEHLWHVTPVHLLATAGLRLLSKAQRSSILQTCRQLLASSKFIFHHDWAQVIGGDMEGLYAWAAANYVSGALEDASVHHYHQGRKEMAGGTGFHGVLELGGASFQITFMPLSHGKAVEEHMLTAQLPGVPAKIYTHSYLGLGMDSALHKAGDVIKEQQQGQAKVLDPCLPVGYVSPDGRHGNSTFSECLKVAKTVVPIEACKPDNSQGASMHRHSIGSEEAHAGSSASVHCSVAGVPMPPLSGRFLAIENFFWTAKALGLHEQASLQELYDAGTRYCSRHWSSLHAEFSGHIPEQFLLRYCFGAAYIFTLLHAGFGIALDERSLLFTNTLRNRQGGEVNLNWITGAFIVEAMNAERHGMMSFMRRDGVQAHRTPFLLLALPFAGAAVIAVLLLCAPGLPASLRRRVLGVIGLAGSDRSAVSAGTSFASLVSSAQHATVNVRYE